MNIENLDKSKIEQSIANENIRLDIVREKRDKLSDELSRYKKETWFKIEEMTAQYNKMEASIKSGETFIAECQKKLEQLKEQ
jgi:hypothetical protein